MMTFTQVLQTLPQFIDQMQIDQTQPDWGMIYDYVVEQMQTSQLTDSQWDKVCVICDPHMGDSRY